MIEVGRGQRYEVSSCVGGVDVLSTGGFRFGGVGSWGFFGMLACGLGVAADPV